MSKRLILSAVLAGGALLASAGAALAIPLYTTADTNLYATQDLNSGIVGVVPAGTTTEGYCVNGGWCYVDQPAGPDGWASAATIDNPPGTRQQPQPQPQPQQPQPQQPRNNFPGFNFDFNITPPTPTPPRPRPDQGYDEAGVCFYDSEGYGGRSFCARAGEYADDLRSWSDRISSLEVYGGAEVEVCSGTAMSGSCTVYRRDTSRLPSRYNDRISSFEIY